MTLNLSLHGAGVISEMQFHLFPLKAYLLRVRELTFYLARLTETQVCMLNERTHACVPPFMPNVGHRAFYRIFTATYFWRWFCVKCDQFQPTAHIPQ